MARGVSGSLPDLPEIFNTAFVSKEPTSTAAAPSRPLRLAAAARPRGTRKLEWPQWAILNDSDHRHWPEGRCATVTGTVTVHKGHGPVASELWHNERDPQQRSSILLPTGSTVTAHWHELSKVPGDDSTPGPGPGPAGMQQVSTLTVAA